MNLLIGIIIFLSLIAVYLFFRSSEILSITKKRISNSFEDDNNNLNAISGVWFLIIFTAVLVWYSYDQFNNYFLPMASEHAPEIEVLFWVTTAITFVVFIVTQIVMFYFGYKYRFNKQRKAHFYPENHKLEIIWTIIPAIVLTGFITYGLLTWADVMNISQDDDAMVVELYAQQFNWKARYAGNDNSLGKSNVRLIDIDRANILGIDESDPNASDDI